MGTWGSGGFETDGALDWLGDLETDGIEAVRDALGVGKDVEVDDAHAAIAAAEIVAAARGHACEELPEEAEAWARANAASITDEDAALAIKAVTNVRKSSELQELWAEHGDDNDWTRDTQDLLARLRRA